MPVRKYPKGSTCKVKACDRKILSRYMCNRHYQMWLKHGDPLGGKYQILHKKALDHGDGTRTCTKCKKRLTTDKFHKDKTATDGIRATCKKCRIHHVKNWYQDNRERQAGREKKRRLSNPEKYTEKEKIRYAKDRDKRIVLATAFSHKRRAKKKKVKVERGISKLALKKKFGSKCYYCGKEMDFSTGVGRKFNRDMATIEHLIPINDGGGHTWQNTVLACRHCNISKNTKSEKQFKEFKSLNP